MLIIINFNVCVSVCKQYLAEIPNKVVIDKILAYIQLVFKNILEDMLLILGIKVKYSLFSVLISISYIEKYLAQFVRFCPYFSS